VLKIVAGVLTGSVAIITEAVHSSIDLVASLVAWLSVRKADEPADESHPYGHEKVENLAAAFEGVLIVLGAGIIIYEAIRKLSGEPSVEKLGIGIAVIAFSMVANFFVSRFLYRQAHATDSAALEGDAAHLRTDSITSLGVLIALALVAITGVEELDAVAALVVAVAIVFSGVQLVNRSSRVLVDETLPPEEMQAVQEAIAHFGAAEVIGFHKVRARRGGVTPLRRPARAVPPRHDTRARARREPRAAARDPRAPRRRRRADPPRAGGRGRPRRGAAQRRLIAAAAAIASSTAK